VLFVNTDFSRVEVGLKQLEVNPMDKIFNSINVGDEVEGQVIKILPAGAVIKLSNGLTAFAVTKENADRTQVATHHIYKLHAQVKGYISYKNEENHKLNIITNKKHQV